MLVRNNWHTPSVVNPFSLMVLEQNLHVEQVLQQHHCENVFSEFAPWKKYCQGSAPWDIVLLAFAKWMTLQDIASQVDGAQSSLVFVAINKYLLLPEPDPTLDSDYNIAIQQKLTELLKNYQIIEYCYHAQERGNIGNFVVPDNRFVCKRI